MHSVTHEPALPKDLTKNQNCSALLRNPAFFVHETYIKMSFKKRTKEETPQVFN